MLKSPLLAAFVGMVILAWLWRQRQVLPANPPSLARKSQSSMERTGTIPRRLNISMAQAR